MKAVVVDNSGWSSSYGDLSKQLNINEKVDILWQDGCCFKIKTEKDEEFTLNTSRFHLICESCGLTLTPQENKYVCINNTCEHYKLSQLNI